MSALKPASTPIAVSTASLHALNTVPLKQALALLDGIYEHSAWVAEQAMAARPFQSLAQLKYALTQVVELADSARQLQLIYAHPELAGEAAVQQPLTAESAGEQITAGLGHCTPEELAQLRQLNADYRARFGFPFVLAVRGPRGTGLHRAEILATLARRLQHHPRLEHAEALRHIHRIAELRLNDRFDTQPVQGHTVWDWQELLSQHTDAATPANQLTVTYLTDAHRACAQAIARQMHECGCDSVQVDAVGNVVGTYRADPAHQSPLTEVAKTLMTGSHYDTVRNGGKYDGRLGIFVPLACVQTLHQQQRRLSFDIEIVAFAEEEGQRFAATFIGSSALVGGFEPEWLDQCDAAGISLRQAMLHAGLDLAAITALQRDPARYIGFVEVHIEQGPVLNALHLPLGIVTAINGSTRYAGEVQGLACHAGTTPMHSRQDAATAVAELALYVEQRAAQQADLVGTVGMLEVPGGSVNVVPGRCRFSLDLRASQDAQRNALVADVLARLHAIAERRGVHYTVQQLSQVNAAPSNPALQQRWENAVGALGIPLHRMPSGAGHDAMKMHQCMPQAMLFVRGQNGGISHNPLESTTSDDMQLAVDAMLNFLQGLAA